MMMKKLISELSEKEINYWVGQIEGINCSIPHEGKCIRHLPWDVIIGSNDFMMFYDPCKNPAQAWPVIEREKITIYPYNGMWVALSLKSGKRIFGDTSLIAAMRCRVAMFYGNSVEVDDE